MPTDSAGYPLECPSKYRFYKEVGMEDRDRMNVTVDEAAEYLDVSRTTVQEMVDNGQLKADRFAGAIHIPREEVERIERETAP